MKKRIFSFFLALMSLLLLSSCGTKNVAPPETEDTPSTSTTTAVSVHTPGVAWISGERKNPFSSKIKINQQTLQLVYEGLFEIAPDLSASHMLCENYSAEGNVWTIRLKKNVRFHNGETVSAEDAVYSIRFAKSFGGYWSSLLENVASVEAVDEFTLTVHTYSVDAGLPSKLITPIVPVGDGDGDFPSGTGPFRFVTKDNTQMLGAFDDYHGGESEKIKRLTVVEIADNDAYMRAVESHQITVAVSDTTSAGSIYFSGIFDRHSNPSPIIHCMGINSACGFLSNAGVRTIIDSALPRSEIAEDAFEGDLSATGAPEQSASFSEKSAAEIKFALSELGYRDNNGDGAIDYYGSYSQVTLELIVNRDNMKKRDACQMIVNRFAECGITVNITLYSDKKFQNALNSGSYDLCYLETELTADLDFSTLLSCGKLGFSAPYAYQTELAKDAWKAAFEDRNDARKALITAYRTELPFFTLGFETSTALVTRGAYSNVETTWNDPFYNITHWDVLEGRR